SLGVVTIRSFIIASLRDSVRAARRVNSPAHRANGSVCICAPASIVGMGGGGSGFGGGGCGSGGGGGIGDGPGKGGRGGGIGGKGCGRKIECRAVCRLEIGDTADWKSALRYMPQEERCLATRTLVPRRLGLVTRVELTDLLLRGACIRSAVSRRYD